MKKICATIRDKWPVHGIVMFHRTGSVWLVMTSVQFCMCRNVPVGEASVIIAISSRHRKESLEATEFAINTLKATVPIWKKVVFLSLFYMLMLLSRKFMMMDKQNGNKTKNVSG